MLIIFQKENHDVSEEYIDVCNGLIFPPLPLIPELLIAASAGMKITEILIFFSSISHIYTQNNGEPRLCRVITFLIKKKINMLTVTFIIMTNGVFRTQKRSLFQAGVASIQSRVANLGETFNQC